MHVRLHAFEPASRANGPGLRAVLWFQGCTLGCAGCFNPETHPPNDGFEADTESLARDILSLRAIEGVSISGGEPFQQPEALLDLLSRLRRSALGILVFSGYTLEQIRAQALGPEILNRLDVLIAGRYVAALHLGRGLLGSANQKLHLLTSRYQPEDFLCTPSGEVILHRDGAITMSGIAPLRMR
jgi:anaerobic ribonucleoside-triphosphate reductase activating protein